MVGCGGSRLSIAVWAVLRSGQVLVRGGEAAGKLLPVLATDWFSDPENYFFLNVPKPDYWKNALSYARDSCRAVPKYFPELLCRVRLR